ncbi:MAG: hypothetical protein SFV55_27410 [Haliscomenobacter sp.]|uniref:hypothetical protein n=1 Tax=Haliscomenobacter sp. TaxID=2717303 RepID=UPI0029AD44BD|nr:hypothetical protein [Haliscomenobacter sp.]MDX2072192.1 hypothetical protein [Haliscomenobacter sp.]
MKLINPITQESHEAQILPLDADDYEAIANSGQFDFDWTKEKIYQIYKLTLNDEEEILGLMSLIDVPYELRIHLNLIESAKKHQGREKKLEGIPGCLIAFATRIAFNQGYNGFVSLTPKTRLIDYYVQQYGFSQYGRNLAIDGEASMNLIKKYLLS